MFSRLYVLSFRPMATNIIWAATRENLSSGFPTNWDSNQPAKLQRLARKFGSDILFKKGKTMALIRLRECAGWSAPVLFTNPDDRFCRDTGPSYLTCHKTRAHAPVHLFLLPGDGACSACHSIMNHYVFTSVHFILQTHARIQKFFQRGSSFFFS